MSAGAALGWTLTGREPHEALVWSMTLAVGVPLAAIDLGAHRLPDALVLPAVAAAVVVALVGGAPVAVAGGVLLVTAYAVLAVSPRSGLGFGDVKLGGVVAALLLATGRARRDTPLPFGPHMLAGALLAAVLAGSSGSPAEGVEQAVDVGEVVVQVRRGA